MARAASLMIDTTVSMNMTDHLGLKNEMGFPIVEASEAV